MASVLLFNRQAFRAESVKICDGHITDESVMTFVNFIPGVIERSAAAAMASAEVKYHTFRSLIETANRWLQRNSKWRVFNCETVAFLYKYNDIRNYYELAPNDSYFYISGSEKTNVLKGLRLWLSARDVVRDKQDYQDLNYADIEAEMDEKGKFENLDRLVEKANELIRIEEIQGRIICTETVTYEAATDWKIDTEETLSALSTKKLFILRVFYEEGQPLEQEIGITDFIPKHLSGGGFFKRPKFETFSQCMQRASIWLSENTDVTYTNAQSIDVKLSIKSLMKVDSKVMYFTDYGSYLRIFRMAYTRPLIGASLTSNTSLNSSLPISCHLSSKLFMPMRRKDTISNIRERFEEWLQQSYEDFEENERQDRRKIRMLSAESIGMFCKSNDEPLEECADDTFHYNRFGAKNGFIFMIFRLYFDYGDDQLGTINGSSVEPAIAGKEQKVQIVKDLNTNGDQVNGKKKTNVCLKAAKLCSIV